MGLFTEQSNYLILGKKGSGKTALGWKIAETIHKLQNKKVFVYRFPKSNLLNKIPFKVENVNSFNKLFNITDALILFDEAHKHFDVLNKKIDEKLKNLLADSRQNNVDCCFICHNSYFITKSLFTFLDVKMIKEVNDDHWALERPHMKVLYENHPIHGPENYFIDSDWERGKTTFEKPGWFTEEFSNAFRINEKPEDLFEKALRQSAPNPAPLRQSAKPKGKI